MDTNLKKIQNLVEKSNFHKALLIINKLLKKDFNPFFLNIKGNILVMSDRGNSAIEPLLLAIKLAPDFHDAYNTLGMAYQKIDQNEKAIFYLKQAILLKSDYIEARYNLGALYFNLKEYFKAIDEMKIVLSHNPKNLSALVLLGDIYNKINNIDQAIKYHEEALKLNLNAENLYNLGMDYLYQGNIQRAVDCFKPTLPNYIPSYYIIALHSDYDFNDSDIDFLKKVFYESKNIKNKIIAGFALSRILKNKKNFKESFKFLEQANNFKSKDATYDQKKLFILVEKIQKFFLNIKKIKYSFKQYDLIPIFILGPPRSGTSLIEQILTNHPEVYGAGEMDRIDKLFDDLIINNKYKITDLEKVRAKYFSFVKKISDKEYFIDKTPFNSFYLGLIKKIFPESMIINTLRDYKSIAYSMYENNFDSSGLNYTYRIEDIVFYLKTYKKNMNFWTEQCPADFLSIDLDSLVCNLEDEAKKIFSFIKLDFDKKILDYTNNKRPVYTLSASQVRKRNVLSSAFNEKNYGDSIIEFNSLINEI